MVYRTITGVSLQFYVSRLEHLPKSSTLHSSVVGQGVDGSSRRGSGQTLKQQSSQSSFKTVLMYHQ